VSKELFYFFVASVSSELRFLHAQGGERSSTLFTFFLPRSGEVVENERRFPKLFRFCVDRVFFFLPRDVVPMPMNPGTERRGLFSPTPFPSPSTPVVFSTFQSHRYSQLIMQVSLVFLLLPFCARHVFTIFLFFVLNYEDRGPFLFALPCLDIFLWSPFVWYSFFFSHPPCQARPPLGLQSLMGGAFAGRPASSFYVHAG